MGLSHVLVYFLLFQLAWSQLTTIPQGYGYVEDEDMNHKKCATLQINLPVEENDYLAKSLRRDCCDAKRIKSREKRVIAMFIAAVVIFGIEVWYIIRNEKQINRDEETFQEMKAVLEELKKTGELNYDKLNKIIHSTKNSQWDQLLAKFFGTTSLEGILRFFNYDPIDLLKELGFDTKLGTDSLATFDYTFYCGANATNYELVMCGNVNPTRKYGEVQLVAPIGGSFVYKEMFYRYYDVPRYAIVTEDSKEYISAQTCQKIGAHFECQIQKGPCNINDYENCNTVMKRANDQVVTFELGDTTLIATTARDYRMFSNNNEKGVYQVVPPSGHFLFQAPHDHYIEFRGETIQKFYGRHDKLVVSPINVHAKLSMFATHEELDKWDEVQMRIGKGMESYELSLVHGIQGWNWLHPLDSLAYFVKGYEILAGAASGVALLIAFFLLYKFFRWMCRKLSCCGAGGNNDKEKFMLRQM